MKSTILISLLPTILLASSLDFSMGVGDKVMNKETGTNDGKLFSITYNKSFKDLEWLEFSPSIGAFSRKNLIDSTYTGFAEMAVGARLSLKYAFFAVHQGVAYIHKTDINHVSTHYQLPTKLSIGLTKDSVSLGLFLKHFSNGTSKNNLGRNFIGANITWEI